MTTPIETVLREELAEAREARDAHYAAVLDLRSELAEAKAALEKARTGLQYVSDTFPETYEYDNNDMYKIKHDRDALRRSMLHARQVLASLATHPGSESREQALIDAGNNLAAALARIHEMPDYSDALRVWFDLTGFRVAHAAQENDPGDA